MLDPKLLAGVPFRSKTAFEDLVGTVSLMHDGILQATTALTGVSPAKYLFDSGEPAEDILEQIQSQHRALARALGIADPPDLQSFNLAEETDWVSWTFLLADDLNRLKSAAGVV